MPYRYRCGVCRTVSDHDDEHQALTEQAAHSKIAHHGRRPESDQVFLLGQPLPPLPLLVPNKSHTGPPRELIIAALVVLVVVGWWVYCLLTGNEFLPPSH